MQYDTFISYTRKDSDFGRKIAELLKSNGISVWFDEYETVKMDEINEETLKAEIARGIENSRCAILISNSEYAKASFAIDEAERILTRTPRMPVLNIGHPVSPSVAKDLRGICDRSDADPQPAMDFTETHALLEKFFGRILEPLGFCSPIARGVHSFDCRINGGNLLLGLRDWNVKSRIQPKFKQVETAKGPELNCLVGDHRIDISLTIGSFGKRRNDVAELYSDETSPWEYFEWGRNQVKMYSEGVSAKLESILIAEMEELGDTRAKAKRKKGIERLKSKGRKRSRAGFTVFGLHLLQHQQCYSNEFAFSYREHGKYCRRYNILFPNPSGGLDLEFVFTARTDADFNEFFRIIHVADRLVLTSRYG